MKNKVISNLLKISIGEIFKPKFECITMLNILEKFTFFPLKLCILYMYYKMFTKPHIVENVMMPAARTGSYVQTNFTLLWKLLSE